jgi:acetyl-CoA carboxylase biotin carboxyl carrier protein
MRDQEQQPPSGAESSEDKARSEHKRKNRERSRDRAQSQPRRTEQSLNMDELRELVQLLADNSLSEFEFENDKIRVRLRRNVASDVGLPGPSNSEGYPPGAAPVLKSPHQSASAAAAGEKTTPHPSTPHPGAQAEIAASEDEGLHIITSPIVGTFYRSASPAAELFVRLGSLIHPDSVVCIIEAMKLMNEIQAETTGEVAKIYVENGQPVEYGQPLFGIKQ